MCSFSSIPIDIVGDRDDSIGDLFKDIHDYATSNINFGLEDFDRDRSNPQVDNPMPVNEPQDNTIPVNEQQDYPMPIDEPEDNPIQVNEPQDYQMPVDEPQDNPMAFDKQMIDPRLLNLPNPDCSGMFLFRLSPFSQHESLVIAPVDRNPFDLRNKIPKAVMNSDSVSGPSTRRVQKTNTHAGIPSTSAVPAKRKATGRGSGTKRKRAGKDTSTCLGDSVQGNPAKDFSDPERNDEMDIDIVPLSQTGEEDDDFTSGLVSVVFSAINLCSGLNSFATTAPTEVNF